MQEDMELIPGQGTKDPRASNSKAHAPRLLSPHTTALEPAAWVHALQARKKPPAVPSPGSTTEEQPLLTTARESWRTAMKTQYSQKKI